jgi:Bacteriophage clamp loader A subunit
MAKTPFNHIDAIYNNQRMDYYDNLSDIDKKSFSPYVINMGISMNPDFLPVVNEANKYWDQLDARSLYLFYSQAIPKGKYYNKWVKGTKDVDYEDWLVDLVGRKFEVSKSEAKSYLNIFYKTDEGRDELRSICKGFGIDDKKLKKVKL